MDIRNLYNTLVQSLRLVAAPFEIQTTSLPEFVNVPDEIALIYNESYLIAPQLKDKNLISAKILGMLERLDQIFEEMSEVKPIWTLERLRNDSSWERLRILALDILRELNEPDGRPNLDFIDWTE